MEKTLIILSFFVALIACNHPPEEEKISLSQAFVVETKSVNGCLAHQKMQENITSQLKNIDKDLFRITQFTNVTEDLVFQKSIFVSFQIGNKSFLVIELIPTSTNSVALDNINLQHSGNSYSINVSPKNTFKAHLQTKLYFTDNFGVLSSQITCSESSDFEPRTVQYLNIYPLESFLDGNKIPSFFMEEMKNIKSSKLILDKLENQFSTNFRNWSLKKNSIKDIKETEALIKIEDDLGEVFSNTDENFVPHIRQKIMISGTQKPIGAVVKIRSNK